MSSSSASSDNSGLGNVMQEIYTALIDNRFTAVIGEKFSRASTDEERVKALMSVYKKPYTMDMNKITRQDVNLMKKAGTSESFRKRGNDAMEWKDYDEALILYTKSIASAPYDSNKLALAFANRSAALKAMDKFIESIEDIDRAISHGYPEMLLFKLYSRKAQCHRDLGDVAKSTATFCVAEEHVRKSGLPEDKKKELIKFLNEEVKRKVSTLGLMKKPNSSNVPALSYGQNEQFLSASEAIQMEVNETNGRQLVANRDVKPGDVMIVDQPYMTHLEPEFRWSHCNHCHHRSVTLLPCPTCDWALYCSESCREEAADKYHRVECPVMARYLATTDIESTDGIFLVARAIATFGLENLHAFVENGEEENQDPEAKGFNLGGVYDSTNFTTLYHLKENMSKCSLREVSGTCLEMYKLLMCFQLLESPNADKIVGVFLRLYFILTTNIFTIDELQYKSNALVHLEDIGSGIFPTAALITHSCDPNLIRINYGNTQVYRAARPIKKGTPLTLCRLPSLPYYKAPKANRQEKLMNFHIECKCEACIQNWPVKEKFPKHPTFSSQERDLKRKIKEAQAKVEKIQYKFAEKCLDQMIFDIGATNFLPYLFENHKEDITAELSLLSDHGKRVNFAYLKLHWDQETYYQSLGNCLEFSKTRSVVV